MSRHQAQLNQLTSHFTGSIAAAPRYSLRLLNYAHIPQMLALQARTGTENIIARDSEYYKEHFRKGHTALGMVNAHGMLVAHALVRSDRHNTTMLNVLVDPEHRGQSLHSKMIDKWLEIATKAGIKTASARIKIDNIASIRNFDKAGMEITKTELSPEDPTRMTYLMTKSLQKPLIRLVECRQVAY